MLEPDMCGMGIGTLPIRLRPPKDQNNNNNKYNTTQLLPRQILDTKISQKF